MRNSSNLTQWAKLYFSLMINHLAKEFEDNDFKCLSKKIKRNTLTSSKMVERATSPECN